MTKTATDWIAYLEAEPRSEPDLSIAAVLREQAKEIEGLISDNARLMESLTGEVNESERLRGLLTCSRCGAPATKWLRAQLAAVEPAADLASLLHEVVTADDANVDTATCLPYELVDKIRAALNRHDA